MKIRTWLLVSYLVVMFLPLIAAYGLFMWINSYYGDRNIAEYMDVYVELNQLQEVLAEPSLYRIDADFSSVDSLVSEQVSVTLYNELGFIVHSTSLMNQKFASFLSKKDLYEGFYEQRQKFGTIRYKEPVFSGSSLTGVYEIEWKRDEWVAGVGQRTWFIIALFSIFFAAVFIVVAYLVNRKLNEPLYKLMGQMNSFAKGLPAKPLDKSNDELGELAGSFESMRSDLMEANERLAEERRQKEYMIASISHDLKTPLTSIRAYAEALEGNELSNNDQQEYREIIVEKAGYMRQMLDDLLTYTLLQSNTYTMASVLVDGEEFFEMLVSGYHTLCDEKGIELQEIVEVSEAYTVDTKQLIRVVDNLMMNAIRHTPSGHTIWLAAVSTNMVQKDWYFDFVKESLNETEGMYLIVQNEGEGLSGEQLESVFEPLFQADEARTKAGDGGTGLGLSITKQIIENHGGKVQMLSRKNIGTAVICYLPKSKGEEGL